EELRPSEERWWWRLDLLAAEQRRRKVARTVRVVGIALLILALLGGAAYFSLRPDPLTAQKLRLYAAAERSIQEGRWEEAIARYQEAAALDPQDPEPWMRLGWARERTGDAEAAQAAFQEAASRFGDPFAYELALARLYVEAGDFGQALPHALRATELNPQSPHAFYVLASAYEGSGKFLEALQALQTCEKLAEAQGDVELVAMSRVRVGTLLQRMVIPTVTP
ncbi:MAG: tetratricopeptide repeat protein, partial [Anaerolineae bacterium]